MARLARLALSLTLIAAASTATAAAADLSISQAAGERLDVRLFDLGSARLLVHDFVRRHGAMTESTRVAAWADFSTMAEAVTGAALGNAVTFETLVDAASDDGGPHVAATRGVAGRDTVAYRLLTLGYSARETADVVTGRITVRALDVARQMIMIGRGRDAAADYLDSQYKLLAAVPVQPRVLAPDVRRYASTAYDAFIDYYASLHQVESALVRAIVQSESAFNPAARSRAGAIGLMQLMPETARELGVNPFIPEQNIEGGVRYFSQLLKQFGGIELALVAYNAGPGFAQRYARGQIPLYGETRAYVRSVLARLMKNR